MPIYEYRCQKCERVSSIFVSAFTSATLLPGSSEAALLTLLAMAVALCEPGAEDHSCVHTMCRALFDGIDNERRRHPLGYARHHQQAE